MAFLSALAAFGLPLLSQTIGDIPDFYPGVGGSSPTTAPTSPLNVSQDVETTVTVGTPNVTQVVTVGTPGGGSIPVLAPSGFAGQVFPSFPSFNGGQANGVPISSFPAVADAAFLAGTEQRFEGPTTIQNVPLIMVGALVLGALVLGRFLFKK